MTPTLIDSHCHLDFAEFNQDRAAVIARAQALGVRAFVVPGVSRAQWPNLVQLSQQYPTWQLAFGLHPYFIAEHVPADLLYLAHLLTQHPTAAVGEIGLDSVCAQPELQLLLLRKQLQLAQQLGRGVILHHRKTLDTLLSEVKKVQQKGLLQGVVHAFSGSYEQAEAWLQRGFKLGVGGVITYPRAQKTRRVIAALPLTALLLETDSPAMPLQGQQGQRNEPANLRQIFTTLCQLRPEPAEDIAAQLLLNSQTLFPNISI